MTARLSGAVHPVAALFPMLADDDLAELAADIRENGLIHPVVLDADGTLIDGRNRLEACKRAGIDPTFTTLDAERDPVAFILSENVNRRHLTKGQRAMAVAKACELSSQSHRKMASQAGMSGRFVDYAAIVLQYAPELADAVLAGGSLDQAYGIAQTRKRAIDDADQQAVASARQAEAIKARLREKQQAIELLIEEIGPAVPIPTPPPDLTVVARSQSTPAPDPAPSLGAALDAQHELLRRLIRVKSELQTLAAIDPSPSLEGWDATGQVMAVRSAISQIVTAAHAVAEQHNATMRNASKLKAVR